MRGEFLRTSITILALAILATVFAAPNEREDEVPAAKRRQQSAKGESKIDLEQKVDNRCPYCHTEFTLGSAVVRCFECDTLHDSNCWGEHGGCTSLGCGSDQCTSPSQYWKLTPPNRIFTITNPIARSITEAHNAKNQARMEREGRELGQLIVQIEMLEREAKQAPLTAEKLARLLQLREKTQQQFMNSEIRRRYDAVLPLDSYTGDPALATTPTGALLPAIIAMSSPGELSLSTRLAIGPLTWGILQFIGFQEKRKVERQTSIFTTSLNLEFERRGLPAPNLKGFKLIRYIQDKIEPPPRTNCVLRWLFWY